MKKYCILFFILGVHPASSVQIMNQANKNSSFGLTGMGGANVETYKSLGDVFGIQAAVDSMKTAAYANQEMAATSSVSNVNGNHSIHDLSHPRNNQTDTEKRSNGGKIFVYTLNEVKVVCLKWLLLANLFHSCLSLIFFNRISSIFSRRNEHT